MIKGIESKMEGKKHGRELSLEQINAIVLREKIGKKIAEDYPEIANNYKQGSTIREIAESYNFAEKYGLTREGIIWNSLMNALEILISKEERQILARQHQQESGQIRIRALSMKDKKELSKKGTLALGYKPFLDNEERHFLELCKNSEYQHNMGRQKGRPNYYLISKELERRFGIKRSIGVLKQKSYELGKETK